MMNVFRAALVLAAVGLLAACDNSPPAEPAATTEPTPAVSTGPTPSAPLPAAAETEAEPENAVAAPIPAPAAQRPLSRTEQAALQPLFGSWAVDLASCERGAIAISRTRFEGAENGCDILSFVDSGGWNFVATLSCESQGQVARERIGMIPLFSPTGEAIGLTYLDRDNQEVTVYRCE